MFKFAPPPKKKMRGSLLSPHPRFRRLCHGFKVNIVEVKGRTFIVYSILNTCTYSVAILFLSVCKLAVFSLVKNIDNKFCKLCSFLCLIGRRLMPTGVLYIPSHKELLLCLVHLITQTSVFAPSQSCTLICFLFMTSFNGCRLHASQEIVCPRPSAVISPPLVSALD